MLNEDGLINNGRSSVSNQTLMEQHLNGSSGGGNLVFLHPKTDYLIGQHGSNSGEPSPANNIEQLQVFFIFRSKIFIYLHHRA